MGTGVVRARRHEGIRGARVQLGLPRRRARDEPAPGAPHLAAAGRWSTSSPARGILIRSPSMRGVAEEAPGAYKDVAAVVDAAERPASRARWRALEPLVCIKG